jgi:hypothetical protein
MKRVAANSHLEFRWTNSMADAAIAIGTLRRLALAVVEGLDNGLEKGGGGGAVDQAMVEGQT